MVHNITSHFEYNFTKKNMEDDYQIKKFGYTYSRSIMFRKKYILKSRFNKSTNNSYRFSKFYKILNFKNYFKSTDYIVCSNSQISTGKVIQFIVQSSKFNYITDFQLKTCRNLIKKPYKKIMELRIYPYFGITKKPAEVRMGKGKGSKISHYAFPVQAGNSIGVCVKHTNSKINFLKFSNKVNIYFSKLPVRIGLLNGGY